MMINTIGSLNGSTINSLMKPENENNDRNLSFDNLLNTVSSIENNQLETKANIYTMLTTGVGDTHEALIAMNKAASQIKTASVIRDKGIEAYQTIMNMQI